MARIRSVKPETKTAKWRRHDFDPGPTGVGLYRMYDAGDELLYVGISRNLVERWRTHRRTVVWWHDVARISYEIHPNRYAAEVAEKAAIRAEHPVYNIALVAVA